MVIPGLIEMHCHILPGVDDGSKDTETSVKMLRRLALQGAETVALTPHYYSDSISLADFTARRNAAFANLQAALPPDAPRLLLGAEVYVSRYLMNNADLTPICITGTRCALLEHNFSDNFGTETLDRITALTCDHGIRPILAHIERYKALMDHPGLIDELRDMGCATQVNISAFANASFGARRKLLKYLDSGRIDLIGSDCHNLGTRPPDYADGAAVIVKKFGDSALQALIQNAHTLLGC